MELKTEENHIKSNTISDETINNFKQYQTAFL